ncbi:MAG: cysteine desulfurase [Anaerolineae bacterium]|nr:cysteine desulfurase [Anaerolineae bacterium]
MTPGKPIYLDYNATTPCDPRIVQAMMPYFTEIYGNPSNGLHSLGRAAHYAVDTARQKVAELIGANSGEIIFTSGATESNHLAILGTTYYASESRRKIIASSIEHKAVLEPCKRLVEQGFDLVVAPVTPDGVVDLDFLYQAIDENTFLISVQLANNEIGTIQPIEEVARLARHKGALLHCDAAQAVGKIPVDVSKINPDLLSFSSHKIYGPKGIGALYIRGRSIPIYPLLVGGGQEFGLRAGSLNVPAIVGFGMACEIAKDEMVEESTRLGSYQSYLEASLIDSVSGLRINGYRAPRLPNTTNMTLPNVEADVFLLNLPNLMMSTGAACNTGAVEPSHVLQAIGLSRDQASRSVRVCTGRFTSKEEIIEALDQIYGFFEVKFS